MSRTAQLRTMATPMLSPAEKKAHLFPISFHRTANVDRQGMRKLMKTVKTTSCSWLITVMRFW